MVRERKRKTRDSMDDVLILIQKIQRRVLGPVTDQSVVLLRVTFCRRDLSKFWSPMLAI